MESCQNLKFVLIFMVLEEFSNLIVTVNIMVKIFVSFGLLRLGIRSCIEPYVHILIF